MTHSDWTTLNDFVDGLLPPEQHALTDTHVRGCAACRDSVARLRALRAATAALPADADVPGDAWATIRDRIDASKVVEIGAATSGAPGNPASGGSSRVGPRLRLAAAAVLLVSASSATTAWLLLRDRTAPSLAATSIPTPSTAVPSVAAVPPSEVAHAESAALPASVIRVERRYTQTVAELSEALEAVRGKLAPETVRAVERNLQIVDDAIEEVRAALLRDPASESLIDLLDRNYRQKVDLLKRASAHAET